MTTDLLKRLSLLTCSSALTFSGIFLYNLKSFVTEKQYSELITFAIINIGLLCTPIKKNSFDFDKWDISLVIANIYSILILYSNLAVISGSLFIMVSMGIVLTMGSIFIRARYWPSRAYSSMETDEELKYTIDESEVLDGVPLNNEEE